MSWALITHEHKAVLTEALPAVTVPSFLNTGGNLARDSIVAWGLGCSSTQNSSDPFLLLIVMGAISALKCPASLPVTYGELASYGHVPDNIHVCMYVCRYV